MASATSTPKTAPAPPASTPATALSAIASTVASARATFDAGVTRPIEWRRAQLRALRSWLLDNNDNICEALALDMRKPKQAASAGDVLIVANEIAYMLDHLDEWTRPEPQPGSLVFTAGGRPEIRREPLGVVLVIGAWNFPFQLTMLPLAQAIAAGNAVVLKPSEVATHSESFIFRRFPGVLDPRAVKLVFGGAAETTEALKQKFDTIFYTGNGTVGRIIHAAATRHLTPVVLELGGKCPVYIHEDADVGAACKRLFWAKTTQAGQVCLCPDYVLVHKKIAPQFYEALKKVASSYFLPHSARDSPQYARIINHRHFGRLESVMRRQTELGHCRVLFGGEMAEDELYIAPTAFVGVRDDDPIMEDEVFGPLLGIIEVDNEDDAIKRINKRDHPLSLYVFANPKTASKLLNSTSSGSATVNDFYMHSYLPWLPFGGVGGSGMGAYHGEAGFLAFSHRRTTMWMPRGRGDLDAGNAPRYPPKNGKPPSPLVTRIMMMVLVREPAGWLAKTVARAVGRWGRIGALVVLAFWVGRLSSRGKL
ncbi:aldehyde dehydrogenase type III [Zopfochytrium polystomum]|nr:aldehyde dehydrogenase type III [Zopfochytrium polystomum]